MALAVHGEFSIVIAGLGAGLEPQLGPLSAAYVLLLAVSRSHSRARQQIASPAHQSSTLGSTRSVTKDSKEQLGAL
jgi:hypothetical protein